MPLTQEKVEQMLGKAPQDKGFAEASNTLQIYEQISQGLAALNQQIVNMYAPSDQWNPAAVVGAIKGYSDTVKTVIEKTKDRIKTDPNLGPLLGDYLSGRSKLVTTYKNAALPWLNYIQDKTVYGKVQAGIAEENARKTLEIAGAQKEATAKQIPELAKLLDELHRINR